MKILGIIPARAGSLRVRDKNKRSLGGKPLIGHILDASIQCSLIDTLVVSTNDDEILENLENRDELYLIRRPEAISTSDSPAIDYVKHTLDTLASSYDIVVILQPTSPFTTTDDITATIELLKSSKADSAVTVMKLDHAVHPLKMKKLENGQLIPLFEEERGRMAEKDLQKVYVRNGSVYATRLHVIEKGAIIGNTCLAYVMPRERSIDINDELDFSFAEYIISKQGKA